MGSIDRYVIRTSFGAFLMVLVSLTAVIWITHALRDIDIVTNQKQTVLVFVGITMLLIPALVLVIAPLALMVAIAYTLNKLNADSEIVVMNAAGLSPWRIFFPFLVVAGVVAVLVAVVSGYVAPRSLRELRTVLTQVRADVVANIIQPGRFTSVDGQKLTFHVRERRPNGELVGIFIDDRRDEKERATFLAERGHVVENEIGAFLILQNGSAHRLLTDQRDPNVVVFERYAFDLSQFSGAGAVPTFNVSERYLWDLISPDMSDPYIKANLARVWPELNDRLTAPIYPLVFAVISFAILGAPRTTRQSRGLSLVIAFVIVAAIRLGGFASVVFASRSPAAIGGVYALLALSFGFGLWVISRGTIIEPPAFLVRAWAGAQRRLGRAGQTAAAPA